MNREIWKRLLWKEWRENWLYLLIGVGVPLAYVAISKLSNEMPNIDLIGSLFIFTFILVTVYAIIKAIFNFQSYKIIEKQLPVKRNIRYIINYFVPMLIPVLFGLSCAYMEISINAMVISFDSGIYIQSLPDDKIICYLVLIMLAWYLLITTATRFLSKIHRLIIGILLLLRVLYSYFSGITISIEYLLWIIASMVTAIFIWEFCQIKNRSSIGNNSVFIILFLTSILPLNFLNQVFGEIIVGQKLNKYEVIESTNDIITTGDSANNFQYRVKTAYSEHLKCCVKAIISGNGDKKKLVYNDGVKEIYSKQTFSQVVKVIAIMENDTGVLIEKADNIRLSSHLIRWLPKDNTIINIAEIPNLFNSNGNFSFLYRIVNGNFIIIYNKNSMLGIADIWIVDMLQGKANLIGIINDELNFLKSPPLIVKWEKDIVDCYTSDKKITVSLKTLQSIEEKLPIMRTIK